MNLMAVSNYLQAQSKFCVERHNQCMNCGDTHGALKYSILADLYLTFSGAALNALTPEDLMKVRVPEIGDLDARD